MKYFQYISLCEGPARNFCTKEHMNIINWTETPKFLFQFVILISIYNGIVENSHGSDW